MEIHQANSSEVIEKNRGKIKSVCDLEKSGFSYIFTKGVFDIIHAGHLSLFSYIEGIKESNRLVVGVSSDRVTKEKKGNQRPINNEKIRLDQISALSVVDFVVLHDSSEYVDIISKLKPAVYIKGMDTAIVRGANNDIMKNNPELVVLPKNSLFIIYCDDGTLSTTKLIENIKLTK